MSKNYGKIFEEQIKKSVSPDMYYLRIKDSTMRFKGDSNICDCFIFYNRTCFMLELKSSQETSLPFGNIKEHQFNGLMDAGKIDGIEAGLLVEMRRYKETYFVPIKDAMEYKNSTTRKSFSRDFLIEKGIKLEQTLKRTRYVFNIEKLLNDILNKGDL
ncbi:Holliday junction resolvase RecU [uncultured Clostridium sp.]|uniref:Holliday junction resolvase RecU n=1 Tax=uncultured Clostridium sp. TaxID=59620 RepID=UPI0025F012B1|nr:Holliday junction resolvase RecU [uncultured Clostridium sp.]